MAAVFFWIFPCFFSVAIIVDGISGFFTFANRNRQEEHTHTTCRQDRMPCHHRIASHKSNIYREREQKKRCNWNIFLIIIVVIICFVRQFFFICVFFIYIPLSLELVFELAYRKNAKSGNLRFFRSWLNVIYGFWCCEPIFFFFQLQCKLLISMNFKHITN